MTHRGNLRSRLAMMAPMNERTRLMFEFSPFPTAPSVGGTVQGGLVEPATAWSLILLVLATCCGVLWTIGYLRGPRDDDGRAHSAPLEAIEKEAA
jgi:hypothetical protein